jgi:general secretion pathway protein D
VQDLNNPAGVITNKRSLDTTVLVDDGQTLVLGGLIQDQVTNGEYKVPLLGDIPLIGWLFRYETRKSAKTNLMIFIRPTVLRNADTSKGLTQNRYDYLREQQEKNQLSWHLLLPSMPSPVSPELTSAPASSVPATGTVSQETTTPGKVPATAEATEGSTATAAPPPTANEPVAEGNSAPAAPNP